MTSTIAETITSCTCLLKQQIEILLLKGEMSEEDKKAHAEEVVRIMNSVSDKLFEQGEVAKTYPQDEALRELDVVMDLLSEIATFDDELEKSEYLGRAEVRIASRRLIHAFYVLERPLRKRAFSNRKRSFNQSEFTLP